MVISTNRSHTRTYWTLAETGNPRGRLGVRRSALIGRGQALHDCARAGIWYLDPRTRHCYCTESLHSWYAIVHHHRPKIMSKVCCPCPICHGKPVSNYLRRQHMKLFVTTAHHEQEDTVPVVSGDLDQHHLSVVEPDKSLVSLAVQ